MVLDSRAAWGAALEQFTQGIRTLRRLPKGSYICEALDRILRGGGFNDEGVVLSHDGEGNYQLAVTTRDLAQAERMKARLASLDAGVVREIMVTASPKLNVKRCTLTVTLVRRPTE